MIIKPTLPIHPKFQRQVMKICITHLRDNIKRHVHTNEYGYLASTRRLLNEGYKIIGVKHYE